MMEKLLVKTKFFSVILINLKLLTDLVSLPATKDSTSLCFFKEMQEYLFSSTLETHLLL